MTKEALIEAVVRGDDTNDMWDEFILGDANLSDLVKAPWSGEGIYADEDSALTRASRLSVRFGVCTALLAHAHRKARIEAGI